MRISQFWFLIYLKAVISSGALCYGAKILGIFPLPFMSHFSSTGAVMKSLVDAGHEVTMVSPFARELSKDNYSSIIDLSNSIPLQMSSGSYRKHHNTGAYESIRVGFYLEKNLCYKVFNSQAFQELIFSKKTHFDAVFIEVLLLYQCYLPVANKFNAPLIGITTIKSPIIADLVLKNPRHPGDVSDEQIFSWRFDNFFSRLNNLWHIAVMRYLWIFDVAPTVKKFHRNYEDKLELYEGYLDMEPALMFYNNHHSILPRAKNPNVVEIGGIQVRPAKPLPLKIQKFIDEADYGVILFTFGSFVNVSSLPASVVYTFLQVFSSIPQRVVWKFEKTLKNVPENVMLQDWLPQRDILEHPNVRAFISHCGLGGMYEAIHTATPIIACPLMFDQPSNAAILEHLGVAVRLDIESITKKCLLSAVNSIINDTRYNDKMQKVSQAFLDRPLAHQQSVVFWTEYVIKYKDSLNLMPPSSRLNFFQYYLLDVVFFFVLMLVAALFITRRAVLIFLRLFKKKMDLCFRLKNKPD